MGAYEKCEKLLKNYNNYKLGLAVDDGKIAKKCVDKIDKAIASLKDEEYIGIITMHYIDRLTMERVAEVYDISLVTAYAQKKLQVSFVTSKKQNQENFNGAKTH